MPIQKRTIGSIPFTQVPNVIFNLGNSDAIAIYCYLLSKPENWIIRRTDVMKTIGVGRVRYDKAITLLKDNDLFSTAYSKNPDTGLLEGTVAWLYVPDEHHRTLQKPTIAETDMSESASLAEPDHVVKKDLLVKKDTLVNKEKIKHMCFTAPTPDEVKAYAIEKGMTLDHEDFVDFYDSKGWMVGKNKMKNWKSAASRWARNNKTRSNNNGKDNSTHSFLEEQAKRVFGGITGIKNISNT